MPLTAFCSSSAFRAHFLTQGQKSALLLLAHPPGAVGQQEGEVVPFRSNTWDEPVSFNDTIAPPVSNNTTTTSDKEIPCLEAHGGEDGQSFKSEDICPAQWSVDDVCEFLKKNDCAAYCDNFSKQKINGEALLTLTKEKCFDLTGGKAGPSIKIAHLITCLNKIVQNPNRFKSALKKPLL
ncbi:hypothetical protein M8J75_001447 [Diaphorina citri]|nr:hypothetical protein M8J75_001447 [Diaphorina citri]